LPDPEAWKADIAPPGAIFRRSFYGGSALPGRLVGRTITVLDSIDAGARRMGSLIDDHERRAVHGRNRRPGTAQGALTKYARLVGQAPGGAVCGPGGRVDGMSPNAS